MTNTLMQSGRWGRGLPTGSCAGSIWPGISLAPDEGVTHPKRLVVVRSAEGTQPGNNCPPGSPHPERPDCSYEERVA